MNPKIWGPSAWFFLHSVTFRYPDNPSKQDKYNYKTFFESLKYILPCYKCSLNYKKHLDEYPINDDVLQSRKSLINWLIKIHNEVNKELHKPILTYNEVISDFERQIKSIQYNELFICKLIIGILLIFIIYKYSMKQLKF